MKTEIDAKDVKWALENCGGGGENCNECAFFGADGCISKLNKAAVKVIMVLESNLEREKRRAKK